MRFDCARAISGASGTLRTSICAVGAALAIALGGCSATTRVYNGTPVLMLTGESAGDFASYSVGLYTVTLTRSDGYVVYAQATDQEVDLTRRTNLTELFNATGIPVGTYKSMTVSLDYSSPVVYLKGQTTPAKVESSGGTVNPGVISETVNFSPSHPLVVSLNQSTPVAIDVDLAASNSINASANTVTVKPFIVATVLPYDSNPLRARGQIVKSNPGSGNFIENIRPFDDTYYTDGDVGALTVNATSSTYFNINGTSYTGTAGLTALASLNPGVTVTAYGSLGNLSTITPELNATAVYAGTSVISPGNEALRGVVASRSGNTLTLQGAEYVCQVNVCFSNAAYTYYPTATVTVGSGTVVSEDGVAASGLTQQSVSVGQRITALGIGTVSSSNALSFNASAGQIRLQPTDLWGTLGSGALGSATVNLLELGNYAPSSFNFSGTGLTASSDANPASYTVNTGSYDASTLSANTLLNATGIVTPFGSAPPDFTASTVANMSSGPSTLIVEWTSGTTAPFTSQGSSGVVVNLSNSSITSALMRTGPQTVQLSSLASSPTIIAGCSSGTCSGNSEYAVGNATSGVNVYDSPSSFLSGLASAVNGSNKVFKLVAIGTYDSASNTFYTQRMDVALE
jgi:hypothetical protein